MLLLVLMTVSVKMQADEADQNKVKTMKLTATGNLVADCQSFEGSETDKMSNGTPVIDSATKRGRGISLRRSIRSKSPASHASESDELNTSRRRSIIPGFGRSRKGDDELSTSKHRSSASLLGKLLR